VKKNHVSLFSTTALRTAAGPMTASERRVGRYLRAPEGHGSGEGGEGGSGGAPGGPGGGITIERSVADINAVPEPLRPFYRQEGSAYVLDDPAELRGHLTNLKNENKTVKGKLANLRQLEELGLSPDEAKQLIADRDAAAERRAKEEGDWTSLREQLEANHNKKAEEWNGREKKLLTTIDRVLVQDAARSALSDPEIEGNPTLLLPLIRDRVKVTETEDGFELQVLREDGAPLLNGENKPATLKDLFLDMKAKPEYAGAFKGVNQSGGGAPPGKGGNGGGAPGNLTRSTMTNIQKVSYIQEHGQAAYEALPFK
jgi:hypothetical protein